MKAVRHLIRRGWPLLWGVLVAFLLVEAGPREVSAHAVDISPLQHGELSFEAGSRLFTGTALIPQLPELPSVSGKQPSEGPEFGSPLAEPPSDPAEGPFIPF